MRQRKNSLIGFGAIIIFAAFILTSSLPLNVMADGWPDPPESINDTIPVNTSVGTSNSAPSDPIDPNTDPEIELILTITEIISNLI